MVEMARFVKPILEHDARRSAVARTRATCGAGRIGRRFPQLAPGDRYNLVQLMTMSAVDFLDQWFETDVLKATMAASGIIGTFLGVRSPGTAYVLLHHYMGEIDGAFRSWGFARGGTGAISLAIAGAAREAGVEIRTDAPVAQILVENGRAVGVVLENGDELARRVVVSSADPRLTFLRPGRRSAPARASSSSTCGGSGIRGSSGKVNLALDALPDFTCLPGRGRAPARRDLDLARRRLHGARVRRCEIRAVLAAAVHRHGDSHADRSVGRAARQAHPVVLRAVRAVSPARHARGTTERDAFGDAVIDTIAEYAPNIRDIILHRQVLTPLDLEREFGLTEGNIFHGELSLEQLFFLRPAPGWAKYRTPVRGLYLCGSGAHPGGGIMAAPGRNAAWAVMRGHRGGAVAVGSGGSDGVADVRMHDAQCTTVRPSRLFARWSPERW